MSQQQQSSPNPTTTPQSLSLSLSEDSATTFDSTQPVISPKSTSGGSSFRSGGGSSRQSGGKGRSSCLSTLCWYTLVFFVLLIVFGVAFGAGFAVAKCKFDYPFKFLAFFGNRFFQICSILTVILHPPPLPSHLHPHLIIHFSSQTVPATTRTHFSILNPVRTTTHHHHQCSQFQLLTIS